MEQIISKLLQTISNKKRLIFFYALLGGVASLGTPPIYLLPLAIFAFSFFLASLQQIADFKTRLTALSSFLYGYFLITLHWIPHSTTFDEETKWLFLIGLLFIPMVVVFLALPFFLPYIYFARNRTSNQNYFIFILTWGIFEYSRYFFPFGGFPWQTISNTLMFSYALPQVAFYIKSYGLNFIAIALFCCFYPLMLTRNLKSYLLVGVNIIIIVGIYIYGFISLNNAATLFSNTEFMGVQGNAKQEFINDPSKVSLVFDYYYQYTKRQVMPGKDIIIIWPESALVQYEEWQEPELAKIMSELLPTDNSLIFFTSAYRSSDDKLHMVALAVNHEGKVIARYKKRHLVPFGEYVPLRFLFGNLKVVKQTQDFEAGTEATIVTHNGSIFLPLVCYDIIFSGDLIAKESLQRPNAIIHMTNEGWFGETIGPYQKLAMTRLRAIEEKVPVIKLSNNGISAVIDSRGRIVKSIGLNQSGLLYGRIPR